MDDESGQVTLIFYKLSPRWWTEPTLNLLAAAAQMSSFTHVELAIGSDAGSRGEMKNVCRIFNDSVGVELSARTGRNPLFSYLQLGCSKTQEVRMLQFAQTCVGTPFSGTAMARSIIWPRKTNGKSYFCAELVADVLKTGGLLDPISNPGAATPEGLHELYRTRATTTANPFLLRQANCQRSLTTRSLVYHSTPPTTTQPIPQPPSRPPFAASRNIPFCGTENIWSATTQQTALRVLNEGSFYSSNHQTSETLGLTMNSLDFRSRK